MPKKSRLSSSAPVSRKDRFRNTPTEDNPSSTNCTALRSNTGSKAEVKATDRNPQEKRFSFGAGHSGSSQQHRVPVYDDDELSMLRSIACSSQSDRDTMPKRLARLQEHEYEDCSDNEQISAERDLWKNYDVYLKKSRARSAGARGSGVCDMEFRVAGYRHEKMKSSSSRESHDDRLNGLIYDPDFDCYYNPDTDQYYRLQPES
ncbi:hypothetical protein RB195_000531 [Necator americanus]|uniref:Uncharacterized protein n=1 Tax=Necator americanus TaxID=51031 RepID=A0ABR1DA80_NECAM